MKRIYCIIIILCIFISLVACSIKGKDTSQTSIETTPLTVESQSEEISIPQEKPYDFEFNPYVLTSEYKELYGEEFIKTYKNFVNAYLNYENTCSCPSSDYAYLILNMQLVNFILFDVDAYFDYDNYYDEQTKTIQIFYSSESKEEHDKLIDNFIQNLSEIIENNVMQNYSDLIKAIAVYRAFSSDVSYDYYSAENDVITDVSPYNAIVNHIGICQSFAGAYTYLLLQLGIDANTCGGMTYDSTIAHEWVIIKLDDKYYYSDPTFENSDTGGLGLKYFGITSKEREEAGNYDPQYFNIGSTNKIWARDYDVSDAKFEPFRDCFSFKIDHENNSIICFDENGSEYITVS